MAGFAFKGLFILAICCVLVSGCDHAPREMTISRLDVLMDFETRLSEANFILVESDSSAVTRSWETLEMGGRIPETWFIGFVGNQVTIPSPDPVTAYGISHSDGRTTVVYPLGEPHYPEYGEILPLAVAHYIVPQGDFDIILLVICYQADPKGSMLGIGARTISPDGEDLSAPFAIAMNPGELQGKFFYDDFLDSGEAQAICERFESNQCFLLLTRLNDDSILSTYVPWY